LVFAIVRSVFLSNEEKINLVIKYILIREKNALKSIQYIKSMKNSKLKRGREKYLPHEPIPYKNIEEFLRLNPNCCKITLNYITSDYEANPISCWQRLTGWSAIVGVRYIARYRDDNGIGQVKKVEIFPGISNCGELIWELV